MDYNMYHLTDLRRYAKMIGIKNPTRLCKKDLIEKILEVETDETKAHFTTKGRKMKEVFNPLLIEEEEKKEDRKEIYLRIVKKTQAFLLELEEEINKL